MPIWLQATLVTAFWLVFWPCLAIWAHHAQKQSQRSRVRDLYPPRIHASQTTPEAR